MRKLICAAIIGMFFCFPGMAFAWYDLYGRWFIEGGGYAERDFQVVDLDNWGELFILTIREGGVMYVTGYDVWVALNAPEFGINAWGRSVSVNLRYPVRIPDAPPTRDRPFRLPPITSDGLTYDVVLTSPTTGSIWIYGYVGDGVEIDSLSYVWKDDKMDKDKNKGCNTGAEAELLLVVVVFVLTFKKRT